MVQLKGDEERSVRLELLEENWGARQDWKKGRLRSNINKAPFSTRKKGTFTVGYRGEDGALLATLENRRKEGPGGS